MPPQPTAAYFTLSGTIHAPDFSGIRPILPSPILAGYACAWVGRGRWAARPRGRGDRARAGAAGRRRGRAGGRVRAGRVRADPARRRDPRGGPAPPRAAL